MIWLRTRAAKELAITPRHLTRLAQKIGKENQVIGGYVRQIFTNAEMDRMRELTKNHLKKECPLSSDSD